MRRLSNIRWLAVVLLLVLVAVGSLFVFRRVNERTEIRNSSGQTITNVVLELCDIQTAWSVTKSVRALGPGESVRVYHTHRDTKAVVTFALAGRKLRHDEAYIDLWTGEGWRFDIQPDGTVASGYDSSHRH